MWERWKQGGSLQMKLSYLNGITHRYNGFWPKLVAYGQRSDAVPDGPDTGRARAGIVCDRYGISIPALARRPGRLTSTFSAL